MTQGKALLVGAVAIAVFLVATVVLGAAVLFAAVILLIGPHGGGILPEWSHLPVLAVLAVGVGYVSFRASRWAHMTLARRIGAI
jgi:hypothetical protein